MVWLTNILRGGRKPSLLVGDLCRQVIAKFQLLFPALRLQADRYVFIDHLSLRGSAGG